MLGFQMALYTAWMVILFLLIQTLAVAIQALKLFEFFKGIFVLSVVGRLELSQSVFQAGEEKKKKCKTELKLSAQFISSDRELW